MIAWCVVNKMLRQEKVEVQKAAFEMALEAI